MPFVIYFDLTSSLTIMLYFVGSVGGGGIDQGLLSRFYFLLYLSPTDILKCKPTNINSILWRVRVRRERRLLGSSHLSY